MKDYAQGKPWKIAKQQHILETAYQLFSQKGIEKVSIPDIAAASGVGRMTVFRYFSSKMDLVIAIATWKWETYIQANQSSLPKETIEQMTGAEHLRFFLDSFLDLYRNHQDILRFNYDFNGFLRYEGNNEEQKLPYMRVVDNLGAGFHKLYEKGRKDGTLNTEISEETMFSSSFHIMLAAATRYAVGLVYVMQESIDPCDELIMLERMLLREFTREQR